MQVYLNTGSKASESEHLLWLSSQLIIEILPVIYDYICLYNMLCQTNRPNMVHRLATADKGFQIMPQNKAAC